MAIGNGLMLGSAEVVPPRVRDDFLVFLGVNEGGSAACVKSLLELNDIAYQSVDDDNDFREKLAESGNGLAVISPEFFERCHVKLWGSFRGRKAPVPFVLWVGNDPINVDQLVQALRHGASEVIHGAAHEEKLLSVINGHRSRARHGENEDSSSPFDAPYAFGNGQELAPAPSIHGSSDAARPLLKVDRVKAFPAAARRPNEFALARANRISPRSTNEEKVREIAEIIQGESAALNSLRRLIVDVAETCATVMIYGESGTGKELVAHALHNLSKRAAKPFVPVNMSAIPEGLAESLLFGHEKGSFTHAVQKQPGWCAQADGGTLFLDEIGEMELSVQPKLLRFLQEGVIQRVGSAQQTKVNVRLITATNRDPKTIVQEGRLREDLFFRLHVVPIYLPPLRERREDIDRLAKLFLNRSAARHDRPARGFTEEAFEVLQRFDWPGNVRQLENAIERLVIFSRHEIIEAMDIPAEFHAPTHLLGKPAGRGEATDGNGVDHLGWLTPIQINERVVVIDALQRTDGHVVDAARILGLGQATMYRKIKQYGIPHERRRRRSAPR